MSRPTAREIRLNSRCRKRRVARRSGRGGVSGSSNGEVSSVSVSLIVLILTHGLLLAGFAAASQVVIDQGAGHSPHFERRLQQTAQLPARESIEVDAAGMRALLPAEQARQQRVLIGGEDNRAAAAR